MFFGPLAPSAALLVYAAANRKISRELSKQRCLLHPERNSTRCLSANALRTRAFLNFWYVILLFSGTGIAYSNKRTTSKITCKKQNAIVVVLEYLATALRVVDDICLTPTVTHGGRGKKPTASSKEKICSYPCQWRLRPSRETTYFHHVPIRAHTVRSGRSGAGGEGRKRV